VHHVHLPRIIDGKRRLGRPRHTWEYNTKINPQETVWRGKDWIDLAQDTDRWRTLVNAVMNFRVEKSAGNFLAEELLASQEGLCSVEFY
jgi:hypothetical protein